MSLYRRKNKDGEESGPWWYCFTVKGQKYRASTRTRVRSDAEKVERRARTEIEEAAAGAHRGIADIAQAAEWDLSRAIAKGKSKTWIASLRTTWKIIGRILDARTSLDRIRYGDLEAYVLTRREEGIRGQTIRRDLQTLRRGMKLAKKRGYLVRVPEMWPEVDKDPVCEGRKGTFIPVDVLKAWLAKLHQDAKREALVILYTGSRDEEHHRMQWSWVEEAPEGFPVPWILRFPSWATKNRRERVVGLTAEAYNVLKEIWEERGDPLFPKKSHKTARRLAAEKVGWHRTITLRDLRHTRGTLALQGTGDLEAVRDDLGHSDAKTTQHYLSSVTARTAAVSAAVEVAVKGATGHSSLDTVNSESSKTDEESAPPTGFEPVAYGLGNHEIEVLTHLLECGGCLSRALEAVELHGCAQQGGHSELTRDVG